MEKMQEGTSTVSILMMNEATHTTGTAVMQYTEKCLNPIFNKPDTITTTLEEIISMEKPY